jgi:hypothetical protein
MSENEKFSNKEIQEIVVTIFFAIVMLFLFTKILFF